MLTDVKVIQAVEVIYLFILCYFIIKFLRKRSVMSLQWGLDDKKKRYISK